MSTISRRAFLKTVGVGALSVAAMSVLAGCDTVPGTTETVVTGTIEGKAGVDYTVADFLTVATDEADLKVAGGAEWVKAYVTGYETVIDAKSGGTVNYDSATDAQKAEAKAAAEKKAAYVKNDTASVTIKVTNYSEEAVVLPMTGKTGKFVSSAFTATCNGASIPCTVDSFVVAGEETAGTPKTTTFECSVELPTNVKNFEVVVALPNAKAVEYTFENTSYVEELDPSTSAFYALNN